jgi:hypothetical protein
VAASGLRQALDAPLGPLHEEGGTDARASRSTRSGRRVVLFAELQPSRMAKPLNPAVHLAPEIIPHVCRGSVGRRHHPVPGARTEPRQMHAGYALTRAQR